MYRIFIVEDDDVIAEAIADKLCSWGFEAGICGDLRNVMAEFTAFCP